MNEPDDPFGPPPDLEAPVEELTKPAQAARKIDTPPAPILPATWEAPTSRRNIPPEIVEIELDRKHCGRTLGYRDTRTGRRFCAMCGRGV